MTAGAGTTRSETVGLVSQLRGLGAPELFHRAGEVTGRSGCSDLFQGLTERLALLADHHPPSYMHCLRVGLLAAGIAQAERRDGALALLAGMAHDVGKVVVAAEILDWPSRLSREQWSVVHRHPQAGYELVRDGGLPHILAQVAGMHHWFQDRSYGPPAHRVGHPGIDAVALAQLIYFADVADAMTTRRDASSRIVDPTDLSTARAALRGSFPFWAARIDVLLGPKTESEAA